MAFFFIAIGALILWLLGGGALLAIASAWRPQPGKTLFVAFVSLLFLVLPILELIVFATMAFSQFNYGYGNQFGYAFWEVLMMGNFLIVILLLLSSQLLLILFASKRSSIPASDVNPRDSNSTEGYADYHDSRVWDVNMRPAQLVEILRRREWAFLLDIAPIVLIYAVCFSLIGWLPADRGPWDMRMLVWLMMFVGEMLAVAYLLIKDVNQGQSIGKRISKCRAVDIKTGRPVRTDQAVVRNLPFLIPFFPLIELLTASFRADRRRLGDLIAGTIVVQGEANAVAGAHAGSPAKAVPPKKLLPLKKHPLDD